jgi:2-polyprenyl-6-methoxyphenol hydroxylase-like FAD-dependent oxidoreductase
LNVDAKVLISGAGPTGLMPAGELALAGADVEVFEQRTDRTMDSFFAFYGEDTVRVMVTESRRYGVLHAPR